MGIIKCIGILTSGGDAPGMNAAIRAVTRSAIYNGLTVKGIYRGYKGLITGEIQEFKTQNVSNIIQQGGTILKTARCQEFKTPEGRKIAYETMQREGIDALVVIGGDGSLTGARLLAQEFDVPCIGLPGTIDNDLYGTDTTIGYDTALNTILDAVDKIRDTATSHERLFFVEVMGRDAGWLTAASALARNSYCSAPHLIYLPESDFNTESFVEDVRDLLTVQNNVIVAVSEGIHDSNGNYISAGENSSDTFGHSQLSGAGKALELLIRASLPVKVRSVEINILQRCAVHLSSATDLKEAFLSGEKAVSLALQGVTASMVIMKRTSDAPYTIAYDYAEIKNIANEAKSVPREWINARGNNVTYEMLTYLTPLIQGEVPIAYHNGLPNYMDVSHLSSQA